MNQMCHVKLNMGDVIPWIIVKNAAVVSFLLSILLHLGSSFIIKREVKPYFLKTPTNVTVMEGDLAVLRCHVDRLGPKMVVWRKMSLDYPLTIGEMAFSPEDDMSITHTMLSKTSSTWDLLIKNVKPHHAGVYECQVTANHLIARHVTLQVLEHARVQPELKVYGSLYVNMGNKIHLFCNATGVSRAPEQVDWFFDGNSIHPSHPRWRGRLEILKRTSIPGKYYVSELIIDQSTMKDKGNYVCRSSDMNVNSVDVHILNTDKDNLTRRDSDTDAELRSAMGKDSGAAGTSYVNTLLLFTFLIVRLVSR